MNKYKYEWTEERQPNDRIRYDHMLLITPLGEFSLEWKGWKEFGSVCVYLDQDYLDVFNTTEEAKEYVDGFLRNKLNNLGVFIMTARKDKWIEEGFYDCCSGYWMLTYSLYDTNGEWLDSVTNVDYIPMHYYLKDTTKTYDDYEEELEKGIFPDYSHLYEVVYDVSIDHTMNWSCRDD